MPRMRKEIQSENVPQMASVQTHRPGAVPLRHVRERLAERRAAQGPHGSTHGGEAVQVPGLRRVLQEAVAPDGSPQREAHQAAAIRVRDLQQGLPVEQRAEETHDGSHGREAVHMSEMWQDIHEKHSAQGAQGEDVSVISRSLCGLVLYEYCS